MAETFVVVMFTLDVVLEDMFVLVFPGMNDQPVFLLTFVKFSCCTCFHNE